MGLIVFPLLIYLLPTGLALVTVALFKNKVYVDMVISCVLTVCAWFGLVLLSGRGKTLSNLVVEPAVLALLVCTLVVLRSVFGGVTSLRSWALSMVLLAASLCVAVVVFVVVSPLPE